MSSRYKREMAKKAKQKEMFREAKRRSIKKNEERDALEEMIREQKHCSRMWKERGGIEGLMRRRKIFVAWAMLAFIVGFGLIILSLLVAKSLILSLLICIIVIAMITTLLVLHRPIDDYIYQNRYGVKTPRYGGSGVDVQGSSEPDTLSQLQAKWKQDEIANNIKRMREIQETTYMYGSLHGVSEELKKDKK